MIAGRLWRLLRLDSSAYRETARDESANWLAVAIVGLYVGASLAIDVAYPLEPSTWGPDTPAVRAFQNGLGLANTANGLKLVPRS